MPELHINFSAGFRPDPDAEHGTEVVTEAA
jgi:hypothetical protein